MPSSNSRIAFRYLISRLKQTIIAVLSVTFGISMYIFMNSFMAGVNDTQAEIAFSTVAHVHIYRDLPEDNTNLLTGQLPDNEVVHLRNPKIIQYTRGIENSDEVMSALNSIPEIVTVAPQVNVSVFFRNGSTRSNGMLLGVDPSAEDALFGTGQYMVEGSWEDMYSSNGIILGIGLARKLSAGMGDNINVVTEEGYERNYKIIGIVQTTLASIDNTRAYIGIGKARQLLSENIGYVSDVQINIRDYTQSQQVAERIRRAMPEYKVESWQEANGQLDAANTLRNIIAVAVSLTILLVAGFGIYNIMNMTVNEKIKDIAILKAMGFAGKDVMMIFLFQSMLIGLVGGMIGMILGYVISVIVDGIPFRIATITDLPITYSSTDYVLAFLFGVAATFVAGYLPAKKAAGIDPVEIIRG